MIRDPRFKYMIHIKCFKMFLQTGCKVAAYGVKRLSRIVRVDAQAAASPS